MADEAPGRELYALEPEEFTAARNAMAKRLRAEGRRDDAAVVAKLRRPPLTAWVLNTLARERPDLVAGVLEAGGGLRAATERALDGDASALRSAQAAERRSVDAATAEAARRLEAGGRAGGDAARQRMAATLRAAVADPAVAERLVAGALDDDHEAPGFGLEGFAVSAGPRRRPAPARADKRAPATPAEGDGSDVPPAGDGAAAAADRADGGGDHREHDRMARRRLAAEADEAEQRARDTERAAAEAERRARDLRSAATAAADEAERAVRHARGLEEEAADAERTATERRVTATEAAGRAVDARRRAEEGP